MSKTILFTLPVLFCASLTAQSLTIRGSLADGRQTGCYYCPSVPYALKYSETPVHSSSGIDLAFYKNLNQDLVLSGVWDTSTNPASLDVAAVTLTNQSLQTPNSVRIGASMRFSLAGGANEFAFTVVAFGNGFVPLFDSAFLIDPLTSFLLDLSQLDSSGDLRFNQTIPNDPLLVGLRFWSQAVFVAADQTIWFSNPEATEVRL